jgi:menaquinone-dependent protoporphyrinogen oxidase
MAAMARVLMLCSSTDGQTRRICQRLSGALEGAGHAVSLALVGQASLPAPSGFALVVIGARIRYGRTDPRVVAYVDEHAALLDALPSAFFSVNIVARKPGKDRPETNPYVRKFLRRVVWRPRAQEVFAGRLDYPRYGACDRLIIRFIMWLTGGPTASDVVVEYTDWRRVDAFGAMLVRMAAG